MLLADLQLCAFFTPGGAKSYMRDEGQIDVCTISMPIILSIMLIPVSTIGAHLHGRRTENLIKRSILKIPVSLDVLNLYLNISHVSRGLKVMTLVTSTVQVNTLTTYLVLINVLHPSCLINLSK
ncbi:hypothetical protein O6P43_008109 [Quillaja saponaria]|uniref:Uncharacterized protein n=1 Tax=Quillaja saponaria TaxID=32244 RepID=A0AAD7M4I1_QUISA|nr:hypothetical protein O6P43_008109 [Quillaja saponaria]